MPCIIDFHCESMQAPSNEATISPGSWLSNYSLADLNPFEDPAYVEYRLG
jgi:hypothetical protein